MGLFYTVSRSNVTMNTSNDLATLIGAATRSYRIVELAVVGMATQSTAGELGVFRCSVAGTTGGGAITPTPQNPAQNASGFTVSSTWSVQPTVGAIIRRFPFNANGGVFRFVIPPLQGGLESPGGANAAATLCVRPTIGAFACSLEIVVEEF